MVQVALTTPVAPEEYSPVMAVRDIEIFRPHLEVIEDQSDLLVRRRQEEVRAVRVAGIIAGIPWRVEFTAFARGAAVCEGAAAIGRSGAWDLVFRLEGVPVIWKEINTYASWIKP